MQKKKIILVITILIIIAVALVAGFFVYRSSLEKREIIKSNLNVQNQQTSINNSQSTQPKIQQTTDNNQSGGSTLYELKTFKDNYGFEMKYSPDKTVMNAPTSKIISCNGSCPTTLVVNNIDSAYTNQNINGVDYCIYSGGIGNYNELLYLTIKNNECYGIDISYPYTDCNSYETASAIQDCKSKQKTSQALIIQSVSSIKFTK